MRDVTCSSRGGARPGQEPLGTEPFERVTSGSGCVLAVAVLPACPRAVPCLRRLMTVVARARHLSSAAEEALGVVVSELATNAVLHSGSPDLVVALEADDHSVTVGVRDHGRWRERTAPRSEAVDMDVEFGRGLDLVDAYAVDRSVLSDARGTLVRAVIAL